MKIFDYILYLLFLAASVVPAFFGHVLISALVCMLVISVFSAKCGALSLPLPLAVVFAVAYYLSHNLYIAGLLALIVCLAPFAVGLSIRLNASVTTLLLYSTAILTVALSVGLWYVCNLYNATVATLLFDRFSEALTTMQSYDANMGIISPSQIEAAKAALQAAALSIPSVLIILAAAECLFLAGISRIILEQFSMPCNLPRFYQLSLKKGHAYILLIFSVVGYVSGLFSPVLFNISIITAAIICTCGLSAVDSMFRRSNIPGFVRTIIYIVAFFALSMFVPILLFSFGLIDGIMGKRQQNQQ